MLTFFQLSVPPTALAAWDRRLVMPDQYLTLLISGFHGSYPALSETGQVVSGFAKLRFNVGLTGGKPDKETAEAITRSFGLKEDEKYIPEPEPEIPEFDEDDPDTWDIPVREPTPELEPTMEPGRFDKFSLSTSLESLMNEYLIPLIQLRLRFGIGWAGAEVLLAEQTARQISAEQAYTALEGTIDFVDAEEKGIAHLPLDPFLRPHGSGIEGINLPLVAYSYLVRRTQVRYSLFISALIQFTSSSCVPASVLFVTNAFTPTW
jgi:ubiquitin-conjugating enzyme E2 Q